MDHSAVLARIVAAAGVPVLQMLSRAGAQSLHAYDGDGRSRACGDIDSSHDVQRLHLTVDALRTLPALSHLDLAGTRVADLERLATLPNLRVLVLDRDQWRHLAQRDAIPAGLAGAQLGDLSPLCVPLAEIIDWAVRCTRSSPPSNGS
jgi:hypothetical protein